MQCKVTGTNNIFLDGEVSCIPFQGGQRHSASDIPMRFELFHHTKYQRRQSASDRWYVDRSRSFKTRIFIETHGSLASAVRQKVKEGYRMLVSGKLELDGEDLIIEANYLEIQTSAHAEVLR